MNKMQLVQHVARSVGISNKKAADAVQAILDAVVGALKSGDSVTLTGFGRFSVRERAARAGINPRTLEKIQIPARTVPVFKAGKAFKEAVA